MLAEMLSGGQNAFACSGDSHSLSTPFTRLAWTSNEVAGGAKPVPTAADDDGVIGGLRLRGPPLRGPVLLAAHRVTDQG